MTEAGLKKAEVGRQIMSRIVEGTGNAWPENKRSEREKGIQCEGRDKHPFYIYFKDVP